MSATYYEQKQDRQTGMCAKTQWNPARRVTAVCMTAEAGRVKAILYGAVAEHSRADILWLTWLQWRAMGRAAMVRETDLSLWTVTCRLRQLREAGVPILSWARERDLLSRGQFQYPWDIDESYE